MKILKRLWHLFEYTVWSLALALAACGITMCLWDIARNALDAKSLLELLEQENKEIALAYSECLSKSAKRSKGK